MLDFLADAARGGRRRKVGTTGYCMGGGLALNAAGRFPDRVGAAASFHGGHIASDGARQPAPPGRRDDGHRGASPARRRRLVRRRAVRAPGQGPAPRPASTTRWRPTRPPTASPSPTTRPTTRPPPNATGRRSRTSTGRRCPADGAARLLQEALEVGGRSGRVSGPVVHATHRRAATRRRMSSSISISAWTPAVATSMVEPSKERVPSGRRSSMVRSGCRVRCQPPSCTRW